MKKMKEKAKKKEWKTNGLGKNCIKDKVQLTLHKGTHR
jgi:hypothetical protein